jgi:DNA (cytosine-5)-methyltransferase 1
MPNHASTSLCHPTETRALSLREYARIQEFPDTWEFSGTPAQQYAQVGNAVPALLGRVAGELIASSLDTLVESSWEIQPKLPESFRVIYVQSHVRTRQWFKAGKTFVRDGLSQSNDSNYSAPVVRNKVRNIGSSNG